MFACRYAALRCSAPGVLPARPMRANGAPRPSRSGTNILSTTFSSSRSWRVREAEDRVPLTVVVEGGCTLARSVDAQTEHRGQAFGRRARCLICRTTMAVWVRAPRQHNLPIGGRPIAWLTRVSHPPLCPGSVAGAAGVLPPREDLGEWFWEPSLSATGLRCYCERW